MYPWWLSVAQAKTMNWKVPVKKNAKKRVIRLVLLLCIMQHDP